MEKFRINGISSFAGNSSDAKIALKQLKREVRKNQFHQLKENESILMMNDHFNGAENNYGFTKTIGLRIATIQELS